MGRVLPGPANVRNGTQYILLMIQEVAAPLLPNAEGNDSHSEFSADATAMWARARAVLHGLLAQTGKE
jgi:hypothetical protein